MTPPSVIPSETAKTIARLVIEWAHERGIIDLGVWVLSLRSWIADIPPISEAAARELAKVTPYSSVAIFLAFHTFDPKPPNRICVDQIKGLGGYGG